MLVIMIKMIIYIDIYIYMHIYMYNMYICIYIYIYQKGVSFYKAAGVGRGDQLQPERAPREHPRA